MGGYVLLEDISYRRTCLGGGGEVSVLQMDRSYRRTFLLETVTVSRVS